MSAFLEIWAGIAILAGAIVVGIAALGLIRLRDPFMRMHAATKAGVVGSGCLVYGAAWALGGGGVALDALVIGTLCVVFLLVTSPIASHALGRAAYVSGAPIASATVADALRGHLPRNLFDIAPQRTARERRASPSTPAGATIMSAQEIRAPQEYSAPQSDRLRVLTVWLAGGPHQDAASEFALGLARAHGAKLTALSAVDPGFAERPQAVPVGGLAWSQWLGDRLRLQQRERAAKALADFDARASQAPVDAVSRHAEGALDTLLPLAAGNDMLIVPAGIDRFGRKAADSDELAADLSARGAGPILRVQAARPIRRVALLIAGTPACGRLATTLAATGLWRDAKIAVFAARDDAQSLAGVTAQAALLRAHGWDASEADPIAADATREEIERRIAGFDAAVMAALAIRRSVLDALREDANAALAARASFVLLP